MSKLEHHSFGGTMKKKNFFGLLAPLLISSLGCQEETEGLTKNIDAQAKERKVSVEIKHEEPVLALEPIIEEPLASEALVAPIPDPVLTDEELGVDMRYARSIFDDNSDIPPWRANYIGSYGVLPTRYQDEGPFLYSFDVSRDGRDRHKKRKKWDR